MRLHIAVERWPTREPLGIAGYSFSDLELLIVTVADGGEVGRGEAYGVYYLGETAAGLAAQVEAVRPALEAGPSREALRALLPPGGARCAVDAALWELESRRTARAPWEIAGLPPPRPVPTTQTLWAAPPEALAAQVRALGAAPALKLKLVGDGRDAARVAAVRAAAPDERLLVDANQGLDPDGYTALLPALEAAGVALVEQPFPVGREAWLDGLPRPVPVAADESVQGLADVAGLVGRFDVVNLKLDKCGGLTEGLLMAAEARRLGLGVMVGCMVSTSLSMAPAYVLGQVADVADVDGPLYLARDREPAVVYRDSALEAPETVWGREGPRAFPP